MNFKNISGILIKILPVFVMFFVVVVHTACKRDNPFQAGGVYTETPVVEIPDGPVSYDESIIYPDYKVMVSVPGCSYVQSDGTASFQHTLPAFWIGKFEVVYELWYNVRTWALSHGYSFANVGCEGSYSCVASATPAIRPQQPVTQINWRDAVVWCNAYSEMEGKTPVYRNGGAVIRDSRDSNASAFNSIDTGNAGLGGYRLATEGEWQAAASYINGSTWTHYSYASGANGSDANAVSPHAWYLYNTNGTTKRAGNKLANQLGIFDMSGNAGEYCWDIYGPYPSAPQTYYSGVTSGAARVVRGGGFDNNISYQQVGNRAFYEPYNEAHNISFRVASSAYVQFMTPTITLTITQTFTSTHTPTITVTPTHTNTPQPSATFTITMTPTVNQTVTCTTPYQFGNPSGTPRGDYWSSSIWVSDYTLSTPGTIISFSAQFLSSGGSVIAAVYNSSGGLIVASSQTTTTAGWTAIPVTSTYLAAGTYKLAIQASGGNLLAENQPGMVAYSNTFGTMPSVLPVVNHTQSSISILMYANICQ